MRQLNKLAYLILNILKVQNAGSEMDSMSINDLHQKIYQSGYSYSSIQKWLKVLFEKGFVSYGIKDGNSNTYYITHNGLEEIIRINKGVN